MDHKMKRKLEDKEMICNPMSWPHLVLPLKRKDNSLRNRNLGIIFGYNKEKEIRIYHCYMFDMPPNMKNVPMTIYPNIDTLLADGWVVD